MGEAVKLRTSEQTPAYRPGLVAVLDVGSSKVVCLIGRAEHGSLRVLGAALRESEGLRAGTRLWAYASDGAVLSEHEKQRGATLIDMGGGTTSVGVFLDAHLVHADVVPLGGQQVTADIARMLAAPLSAAERTKALFGAALGDLEGGADVISVPQMGEDGEEGAMRVPRSMLTRIIQARLEEIFGQVQERLRASG